MKRFSFTVMLAAGIGLAVPTSQAALFPPYNNTVALWLLDEAAGTKFNDATTNNNTGVFNRTGTDVSFDTTVKKFGPSSVKVFNAFSTEGGIVPDSASLHALTNNFTVEAWIRWDGSALYGTMLGRADSTVVNGRQWVIGQSSSTTNLQVYVYGNGTYFGADAGRPFPSNVFVHVAFTFASGVLDLYTNGVLAGTATSSTITSVSGQGRLALGDDVYGTSGGGPAFHDGWLDEVRLSDIVRIPGDGSGTNNFLAWNGSLIPEPATFGLSLLGVTGLLLPFLRRFQK